MTPVEAGGSAGGTRGQAVRRVLAACAGLTPGLLIAAAGALNDAPAVTQGGLAAALIAGLAALPLHLLARQGLQPALAGQLLGLLVRLLGGVGLAAAAGFGETAVVALAAGLAVGVLLDAALLGLVLMATPVGCATNGEQLRA